MPGGPVNGSGVYGETTFNNNPASTIIIPTVLQIAADEVDAFTHLTCLYDKYWYNRQDKMTFPIAFFYVKDFHVIRNTNVSKKRILIYEPTISSSDAIAKKLADPLRPGVQEVVIDNSYKDPVTYQLDIVVPYQPVSAQFGRTVKEFQQMLDGFAEIFAGGPAFESFFSAAAPLLQIGGKMVDIAAKFPSNNAANYINVNSLEAMQESQRVVTMKWWTGYDYKYVQVTGLDLTKKGNEDGVFRGTMQLTERPVLTVTPASDAKDPGGINRNWAASAVSTLNNFLLALPIELTQVKENSGESFGLNQVDGTGVFI